MGDGAVWIWNIGEQHFPAAVQIVDLYHAREHLWNLAPKLYPNDAARKNAGSWRHETKSTTVASKACSPPCARAAPLRRNDRDGTHGDGIL